MSLPNGRAGAHNSQGNLIALDEWRHAMAKVKQLTVALENRPGTLAHMAKVLADAKVNIVALLNSTAGAQGSAQLRNWPGSWRRRAPTLSAPTRRCPRGRRRRSWCLRSPDPPSEDKTSNRVAHGTRCSAALM